MKVKVYKSTKKSLLFSFEDIKKQIDNDFKDYDFLLFATSPNYPYQDINFYIKKVFDTDKYAAFHAVDSFCDNSIVDGISVSVFKFENNGSLNLFYVEDIKDKNFLIKTADYINLNKDKLHII
ncbi:MAG: hypothetical protein D6834_01560, partial [Aquificota bacterium]